MELVVEQHEIVDVVVVARVSDAATVLARAMKDMPCDVTTRCDAMRCGVRVWRDAVCGCILKSISGFALAA